MRHRGPDDDGVFSDGPVAFAFRRLSIIDLSPAGHQPFTSADGDTVIVFNGEIFNFVELREELSSKGHVFRSGSDTEVLLASYAEWGVECLPRLNGMWSFLIADRRKGVLFGARDRFGVKPMYRAEVDGTVYFASEIKALRRVSGSSTSVNWKLATRFLAEGGLDEIDTAGQTFFVGITEVGAGTGFTITYDGTERHWRYWNLLEENEGFDGSAPAKFREILEDAVRLRLRSDVPVGVALSGGLDSTSIISLMARMVGSADGSAMHGLHAFSYMPKEFDETPYIRDTIAQTGATLHQASQSPEEFWALLPTVLSVHDEPLHSPTALAGYQVYGLAAREGVRVVLGGQGADESLAGYANYFSEAWLDLLRGVRFSRVLRELKDFGAAHNRSTSALLRQLVFRALATSRMLPRPRRRRVRRYEHFLSGDFRETSRLLPDRAGVVGLRNSLQESLERHPLPLFLRIEDRNSMAHSVEARLPFMDYRVVSFAFQLTNEWKLRGGWNKYVLRQAMQDVIPESVRTRVDKMGFPTAFSLWMRGPLKRQIEEALNDPSLERMGTFDMRQVRNAFAAHVRGEHDHGAALFHVLQFARWFEQVEEAPASRSPMRSVEPVVV